MLKVVAATVSLSVLLSLAAGSAQAQSAAARGVVVNECALVAAEEQKKDDKHLQGNCLKASSAYLTAIVATLPSDQLGVEISAFVVDLATLLAQRCTINSEIAQAIQLASAAAPDDEQKAQIKLVSVTVQQCDYGRTASIVVPFDFGGTNDGASTNRPSGRPASFS